MDALDETPEVICKLQSSLEQYIKPRKTISQIRRILRLHLHAYLQDANHNLVNRPLLLPTLTQNLEGSLHDVKGLSREYLRCVHFNTKARNEYLQLSNEQLVNHNNDNLDSAHSNPDNNDESSPCTDSFVDLVRKKHRYERLNVIHRYIEELALKPAASDDYLDLKVTLKEAADLPQVPNEVMLSSSIDKDSALAKLEILTSHLEKSVFRAKKILKREQKLLSDLKAELPISSFSQNAHSSALEVTRNELISWIESELVQTDCAPNDVTEATPCDTNYQTQVIPDVNSSIESLGKLYSKYVDARKLLLVLAKDEIMSPIAGNSDDQEKIKPVDQLATNSNTLGVIQPYLSELISLSGSQKAFIQLKVHLATSLTKEVESSNQDFDRLAQESHLLASHPIPTFDSERKKADRWISFAEETPSLEKQDSSRHAKQWIYAAQSADNIDREVVLQNLEKVNLSLAEIQRNITKLDLLFGKNKGDQGSYRRRSVWNYFIENTNYFKAEICDNV
ncbi:hypothetical protein GcC1_018005 [Golovinomyces cichoracearum]|uniref:Uncharacterized protein n=1 Tax=Golovinomyces cichoracearum TaxID=62708 RepID=A0A420J5Q3_9PEZI|nr:hypothetical protein GcC1_018005 [Golovinomyces cichoracearum]